MAAEEIVKLKVTTEGDQTALQNLTQLDKLVRKLNNATVNIKVATNFALAEKEINKQVAAIQQNISANAALIQANNSLAAAEMANQAAIKGTNTALEGNVAAANSLMKSLEANAQSYEKLTAAAIGAQAAEGQSAAAAQQTAQTAKQVQQSVDREMDAKGKLVKVDIQLASSEAEIAAANAQEIKAKAELVKAENEVAVAREKSLQALEKTKQAKEKSYQKELDAARSQQQEQARLQRGYTALGQIILRSVTQNIQKATKELKAMNAEMVSIQKVTGATDADMERLKNSAFEVAGALGSKPSDYLSSVTKWAQAGYKGLSEQLGELSAKTQVVGDVNEETANKFLLAVDAAYKYKGNIDALTRVLDGANEISNNYATSVEKLAGGMGIVSSLAEQAGMKVEETMAAIGTITHVTQESGNSAARALRALILNIQGSTEIEIDAETGERWTEDEIQRTAAALGELNVKTREYKNGIMELRNPMEVIGELAEKYRDGLVTEAQLQDVVSSLGGKVRSNQLMALIQGYETYTSMIETYKDALGSADKELEIYLNGWEAKSNKVVAKWAEFVESFKASDLSMGMLDVGNFVLELANTDWGNAAAQIGAVTAAVLALKAAAKTDKGIAILGALNAVPKGLAGIVSEMGRATNGLTGMKAATAAAGKGVSELAKSLYSALGPVGTIVVILTAASAAYDHFGRQAKKAAEKLADARAEYEESSAKLESLQDELKTTQERIDELNGKGGRLTVVEKEELEKLKQQNTELERQIKLQEILNEAKKAERDAAAREALDKGYSGADMGFFQAATVDFWGDTKDFILRDIQGKDFDKAAEYLENSLDRLNKKKEEFLAQKPNVATWTDSEKKMMEQLDSELTAYQSAAVAFRAEMLQNAADLTDPKLVAHWMEVGETLYAAIAPAEALTEKFNRLVDAMDEAEKTRFDEALKRVQADGKVTAQEVQTLIDLFPVLKPLLEGNAGALDTLAQHFTEATEKTRENTDAQKENAEAGKEEGVTWDQIASKLKKYTQQANDVRDAQEELRKTGTLSFDTLVGLLGKYGNAVNDVVMKAIDGKATQEEIFKALEIAYEEDVRHYREAILEKEMDNEDFYASWLAGNQDTVKSLLAQYGIDATNYKTFAGLKEAIENGTQKDLTTIEQGGANARKVIFQRIADAFADSQDAMVQKAQQSTTAISRMYSILVGAIRGAANALSSGIGALAGPVVEKVNEAQAAADAKAWDAVMSTLAAPVSLGGGSSGSRGSGGSGKNWFETQMDNLKTLEEQTKRTNQVLEKSDQDTARKRIDNLRDVQEKILAAQKQFIARGKAETSDEVNQLKIMYQGLGDDIRDIYSSMTDSMTQEHDALIWAFEKKSENPRSMDAMASDNAAMVEQYRKMQEEVHRQAEYFRSQGVRENDKLIRDLQDKWWEYENAIRDMYSNLTDAFNDYIDESSHKIEELGRTTGNVGKQIEIYAERIRKAQETIAALQANNINGANNGAIFDMESQIWGDKDSIRDLQEGLWDELERAFDDIFDKAQDDIDSIGDEIDEIQDRMDDINDILEEYDKELEGILKPINDTLEKLNDQLEAEKKRLEALTDPLNERKNALEDQIKGYYTINPDGSIGPYIKGLDDSLEEIQDQIDKANEELDRVNDAWNEQKDREEEALALQKKQLAVEEAQKAVEEAMLALQTARNERNIYTLKDGVWAWRADEEAVAKAEKALADAEKAKEEAEKDLQDYKEEQAHKQIVKRLEEQIKALEEQKKLLDKQKDLINKQIDAISKQISAYEKESQARQELIQDLIDRKEEEKKAWEDHYEALKEQYKDQIAALEQEKKLAEERKKQAEKQYDDWMDTWKDIQKSIETPARDLSDILNDIARYGTPAMADQIDRVTELLRDLGYAIEDVTGGGGYDPDDNWGGGGNDGSLVSTQDIIAMMKANGWAWANSNDPNERADLHAKNESLGAIIGAKYNAASGDWDYSNVKQGYWDISGIDTSPYRSYSSQGLRVPTLESLQNDSYSIYKKEYGLLSTDDLQPVRPAVSPGYNPVTNTYDDHSIDRSVTINGMTVSGDIGQQMVSIFNKIGLNMGN